MAWLGGASNKKGSRAVRKRGHAGSSTPKGRAKVEQPPAPADYEPPADDTDKDDA